MTSPIYLHLKPGDIPPQLQSTAPFKAILVVEDGAPAEWQDLLADWLVHSGCRYVMAWGHGCEEWHDSVDLANLRAFDYAQISDDDHVMTTWHAKDHLADVFWFSAYAAMHPTLGLGDTYIIHIALTERSAELKKAFRDTIGNG